ncbi:MAG: helix-turn-helix domain-containing protein [Roseburia sp.]
MVKGLGDRLQQQRQLLNMSQKEVAATIGVSPSVISNYESSERTPSIEILIALARLYHCSTDYLLGFEKNDDNLNVSMLNSEQKKLLQHFLLSIT